ncbi:hypothetical protein B0J14DRAFT_566296 [Halenospora varia]|nr:hypothetical protein B0J14DRAFT_566296 [Halenospora varia]
MFNGAPTTFTQFDDLPLEIRLAIWKLASFWPRRVEVYHKYPRCLSYRYLNKLTRRCGRFVTSIRVPNPGIIFVNRESRTEALRHCRVAIEQPHVFGLYIKFFNPKVDTIVLNNFQETRFSAWLKGFGHENLESIELLEIQGVSLAPNREINLF